MSCAYLIVCLFISHINYFCTRFEVLVSLSDDSSLLGCHIKSLGKCFLHFKESWCFHLKDPAVEEEESAWDRSGCYTHSVAYQTATSSFIIPHPTKAPHNAHITMPSLSHCLPLVSHHPFQLYATCNSYTRVTPTCQSLLMFLDCWTLKMKAL